MTGPKFHQIAMSRQEVKREERRPFFLYADECQEVATASMAQLLAGARKYGLGLTLAHQDLRQLEAKAPEVSSALFGNAGTRIAFRVGDRDAKALSEGLSFFGPADLMSLRVGEAIARIDNAQGDCNLATRLLPGVPAHVATERRETVALHSRERYAVRREESRRAEPVRKAPPPEVEPEAPRPTPAPAPTTTPQPPPARRAEVLPPEPRTPKRAPRPPEPPPMGRGGPEHQYLQELVKRWAETKGYRVVIEEPTSDGKGSVDVVLRRGSSRLACEISVTSTVEQEVGNVLKCLAAGFPRVILLSMKKTRLSRVRAALTEKLPPEDVSRVLFFAPEELSLFLDAEGAPPPSEDMVGGYRVKVEYEVPDEAARASRAKAIGDLIARRLKQKK